MSRDISLVNVNKSYKGEAVLKDLSLTIPGGKFFALLGPSGCGKTTILRIIAGFENPDSGIVKLGNENILEVPANERKVNTVFQNYALFPHLSLFDNIGYGLTIRGVHKEEARDKIEKLAAAFNVSNLLSKYPKDISGGQQQRIAIARAIINEPEVLLLDEPLSALDFKLREKMLVELVELQDKTGMTFLYVTHDQFEALTVSDSMTIMSTGGKVEQVGNPKEIYEQPKTLFVANFVGNINTFEGHIEKIDSSLAHISVNELGSFTVKTTNPISEKKAKQPIVMAIRPEKMVLTKKQPKKFANTVKGTIKAIVYYGRSTQYTITLENQSSIIVFEQNEEHIHSHTEDFDYDDTVCVSWHEESAFILKKDDA